MASRLVSSLSLLPPRRARWALVLFGALLCAQGVAKALDPTGYMAALDAFHLLRPATLAPLSLGALALVWTVLELLAGVAMLYGGLARTPAKQLTLGGLLLALGIAWAYLALDAGAYARALPVADSTAFGGYLAARLSGLVLLEDAYMIAIATWLFTRILRWPSLEHARAPFRPRALSAA